MCKYVSARLSKILLLKISIVVINQNGGFEYVLAPLYKRFFAEVIDVVILFILKLIVAFMIIDIFEIDLWVSVHNALCCIVFRKK